MHLSHDRSCAGVCLLAARMMSPARLIPLQLLPTQYLLPHATCALWIFEDAQVGGCSLGLLRRSIALALRVWARAARTLLVCLGRTLPLERRFVALNAVWRFCVFGRMLACDVHTQGVPRMERFSTVFAASACEHTLRCCGRRGATDVPQVLTQTSASEEPFAVWALRVLRRFPHLLSATVSSKAKRQSPPLAPMLQLAERTDVDFCGLS